MNSSNSKAFPPYSNSRSKYQPIYNFLIPKLLDFSVFENFTSSSGTYTKQHSNQVVPWESKMGLYWSKKRQELSKLLFTITFTNHFYDGDKLIKWLFNFLQVLFRFKDCNICSLQFVLSKFSKVLYIFPFIKYTSSLELYTKQIEIIHCIKTISMHK